MGAGITANNLTKVYPGSALPALDKLNLRVQPGEVYGFLGANGAGKSTAIRLLMNFIQPTGGSATVMGYDIVRGSVAIKHHVGYLSGDVALYGRMTGRQFLDYMAELHPLEHAGYRQVLAKDFAAEPRKRLDELSKGNRQKFGIIQAMMHEPEVLILDEPTSGLDPLMQEVFFDHIRRAKNRGASVFLSSHNLAEVQRMCDRIGFIRRGKLVREQSLDELAQSAARTYDIVFAGEVPAAALKKIPRAVVTTDPEKSYAAVSLPAVSLSELFAVLSKCPVAHFSQRELNLESEFMDLYREKKHG